MADGKAGAGSRKRNAALEAMGGGPEPEASEPEAPRKPVKPSKRVAKVMLYTHPKVAKKIKEIALHEDRKANDVYLDAIDLYLTKAGHRGVKYVIEH